MKQLMNTVGDLGRCAWFLTWRTALFIAGVCAVCWLAGGEVM